MMTSDKIRAQGRAAVEAVAALLPEVLWRGLPADRELSAYLRQRHEFGSRDRRLISELFYAFFRWWGWTRLAAPESVGRMFDAAGRGERTGDPAALTLAPGALVPCLLLSLVAQDMDYPQLADFWSEDCELDLQAARAARGATRSDERVRGLLHLMRPTEPRTTFTMEDLVPDWVKPELAESRPVAEWVDWLQKRPPLWLRIQSGDRAEDRAAVVAELRAAGAQPVEHPVLPTAVRMDMGPVNLYTLPVYSEGRVEVQDLASQTVAMVCAPSSGQRWWDVCAGGGGKSLHLAQLMKGKGVVMATDIQDRKLDELRRRARRGGFQNIQIKSWDGKPMRQKQATYDGVLVDAPCTCSGTWRRNPAMRWTARPGEKEEMAAIQQRILNTAVSGVKEGGVLVYATCSFFKRENEQVVTEFLAAHPEFELEPYAHPLTGTPTPGTLQIWPWDGDCDAMFTARMRKRAHAGSS